MIMQIRIWIAQLLRLPIFFAWHIRDKIIWYRTKGWKRFEGWGLHLYVGMFGAGKTSTMVYDAYNLCKRFPQITVVSNFALYNFPAHTQIRPLKNVSDIINAPDNTLVLIDEIGTVFNSRDFMGGKGGVPKLLFQHICQCRKRHIEILATTQRWNFLDKQLRDITATVTKSSVSFRHPFSRMATCRVYDSVDYDMGYTNPLYQPTVIGYEVYIQTDKVRSLYDTSELVETMLNDKSYVSDAEILSNRGDMPREMQEVSHGQRRKARRSVTV